MQYPIGDFVTRDVRYDGSGKEQGNKIEKAKAQHGSPQWALAYVHLIGLNRLVAAS